MHLRNMFFMANKIIIIDWEMAGFNDPFFDLANYSLYACLTEDQEYDLLKFYLQYFPTQAQKDHWNAVKSLVLVFNIFSWFYFLGPIPSHLSSDAVKDFNYYADIFSQNNNNDSDFLFELALSLVNKFFHEYHRCL